MSYSFNELNPGVNQPEAVQRPMMVQQSITRPWITYGILAITIFVYLLQMMVSSGALRQPFIPLAQSVLGADTLNALSANGQASDLLVLIGGKISVLIAAGQLWRLFTPLLLHASLIHIGFNMYALYIIGPSVENYYGHWRYLALYLLGGFGGNVLSFLLSTGISIGASTAIFALVAAEGIFIYQNRAMYGARARPMLVNVLVIVGINLVLGLSPGVDNWGHLGGMIAGLIFAWFGGPLMTVEGIWPTYRLVDKRPPAATWIAGAVVLAIFVALTFVGIQKYS